MSWQDDMLVSMADYIRGCSGVSSVKEVVSWEQNDPSPYYCETCGPDPIEVSINYVTEDDQYKTYFFYGDLGELIRNLT
jgi:hypothetical protein